MYSPKRKYLKILPIRILNETTFFTLIEPNLSAAKGDLLPRLSTEINNETQCKKFHSLPLITDSLTSN